MEIELRHIGGAGNRPASILEIAVKTISGTFVEDIASFSDGKVDVSLINNLKDIINELEEHNNLVDNWNNKK